MSDFHFQNLYTFDERFKESCRVKEKYPDRIPVICEINPKDAKKQQHQQLVKTKYLVHKDMLAGQFIQVIRTKMQLDKNVAIFMIINGRMASSSQIMYNLYERNRHKDGFVYIHYSFENVFG